MSNEIDALLGLGMDDPRQMSAALRRQALAGDTMGGSTISQVAQGGQNDANVAREGAKQAGILAERREDSALKRASAKERYAREKKASQHGRYTRSKTKDPYGNDVITVFDKQSGVERIASFGNGEEYTDEIAQKKGAQRAKQKGAETHAQEDAKIDLNAYEDASSKLNELAQLDIEMQKGIEALDGDEEYGGAETGFISQYFKSLRKNSIALDNVVDRLALTDIGNYTFGSLSEAEGDWLRKANMPMDLDEDDLRVWLSHRQEGVRRLIKATKYEQEMRKYGHKPDSDNIHRILRAGGYQYADME